MEKNERNIIKQTVSEKVTEVEKENVIKGWTLIGYSVEDIAEALGTDVTYVEKCLESAKPIIFKGSQSIDVRYALSDLEIKELLKINIACDVADKLIESNCLELSETFDEITKRKIVTYKLRVLPVKGGVMNDTQTKDI